MADCSICRRSTFTLFGTPHVCPPVWKVWDEEDGEEDDADEIRQSNAEFAAIEWAEQHDSDYEYYLARGNEMVVNVRGQNGKLHRFSLSGEMVAEYRAKELAVVEEKRDGQ